MAKSQQHWGYDLCAALAVLTVVGLVFWLVPPPAEAGQPMSAADTQLIASGGSDDARNAHRRISLVASEADNTRFKPALADVVQDGAGGHFWFTGGGLP